MERYSSSSGKSKHNASSMEDPMPGCAVSLAKGVLATSGSLKRRASEDRLEVKGGPCNGIDQQSFFLRAHSS